MIRVRVRYQGRVQGVGFRATAQYLASRHQLSGWVRNEPGGDVTMEAQGDAAAVGLLLQDIRAAFPVGLLREDRVDLATHASESGFIIAR